MAINFHHIFACVGMRPGHVTDQDLVQGAPFSAEYMAVVQGIGFEITKGRTCGPEQR